MPTYEYECTKCGHIQEEIHSMKDMPKETKCEKCGELSKKIFSKSNVILEDENFFNEKGKF